MYILLSIFSVCVIVISLFFLIGVSSIKTMTKFAKMLICIMFGMEILIMIFIIHECNEKRQIKKDQISFVLNTPEFYSKSASDGLKDALRYYDIKDPEIVYAMARLETGNFHSRLCTEDNNILGLYDSRNNRFYKFDHWTDCVIAYKNLVECKRVNGEGMYSFLERISYALDKDYIAKLQDIVADI